MVPIKIKSIKKIKYKGKMYNLAVEDDETYIAEGIIVHNCRSLLIPVTQDEEYKVSTKLNLEKFGGIQKGVFV